MQFSNIPTAEHLLIESQKGSQPSVFRALFLQRSLACIIWLIDANGLEKAGPI